MQVIQGKPIIPLDEVFYIPDDDVIVRSEEDERYALFHNDAERNFLAVLLVGEVFRTETGKLMARRILNKIPNR